LGVIEVDSATETEIAYFDRAIRFDEKVLRFEIAMEKARGVHVLQGAAHLPENVALVDIEQNAGPDNSVNVGVHEFEDEIEVGIVLSAMHAEKANDERMAAELTKNGDFAISTLGVGRILESAEDFLERDDLLRFPVLGAPDDTVRTFTEPLDNVVALRKLRIEILVAIIFLCHSGILLTEKVERKCR
jgi:hypothetical protein